MPDGPRPTEQDAVDHFFASPAPAAEPATSRKTSRLAAEGTIAEPGVAWRFVDPVTVIDRWSR